MLNLFSRNRRSIDDHGLYVPTMDGPLRPNDYLDKAFLCWTGDSIDDIASSGNALVFSTGSRLIKMSTTCNKPTLVKEFDEPITALAVSDAGVVIAAVLREGLWLKTSKGQWRLISMPDKYAACITAVQWLEEDEILCAIGSVANPISAWPRDLYQGNSSGEVIKVSMVDGTIQVIAQDLKYPCGIAFGGNGKTVVSEAWAHRVIALSSTGSIHTTLLDGLPGYPGRLCVEPEGSILLALFAPRRQLYEFILREQKFREDMLNNLAEEDWIGPTYGRLKSANYPLQQGEVRQMGKLKPWAPSSSYGLLLRCNHAFKPIESWHSRANGQMHGISAAAVMGDDIFVASKGSGSLLKLDTGNSGPKNEV